MEIAKVITARAVRLFDIEEINPQGKNLLPMIQDIRQRYKFVHGPDNLQDTEIDKGLKFWDGSYSTRDIEVAVSLDIFSDGLVATTRSNTSDTDAFLDDVLSWATSTYKIGNENYILKTKRLYRSELVVFSPGTRIHELCERLNKLNELATDIAKQPDDPIQLLGINLGNESQKDRSIFLIERRTGVPFEEHKYYTSASMQTDDHLQMLSLLEGLFS